MIQSAMHYISLVLNQYLKLKFSLVEDHVVLNNIINSDGTEPLINKNKLVLTLINVDQQTLKPYNPTIKKTLEKYSNNTSLTTNINLDILISANFDDYSEALKFLGEAIFFFQENSILDETGNSNFPNGINKIQIDQEQINYLEMQNLWAVMGAKYIPSAIYKTRVLTSQVDQKDVFNTSVINPKIEITK